jgi:hypothetical protein
MIPKIILYKNNYSFMEWYYLYQEYVDNIAEYIY